MITFFVLIVSVHLNVREVLKAVILHYSVWLYVAIDVYMCVNMRAEARVQYLVSSLITFHFTFLR